MAYASLWIKQNLEIEDKVQITLDECDQKLGIDSVLPKNKPKFGYTAALFMLAAAAIVAIIVNVRTIIAVYRFPAVGEGL
jgi:hypothetical protein